MLAEGIPDTNQSSVTNKATLSQGDAFDISYHRPLVWFMLTDYLQLMHLTHIKKNTVNLLHFIPNEFMHKKLKLPIVSNPFIRWVTVTNFAKQQLLL